MKSGRPNGNVRPRKKRYLVVTNGEVTEAQYFKGLEKELGDVVIEVRSYKKDPSALADAAKDLKDREANASNSLGNRGSDDFQRIYVVTDVDDFTVKQFQDARRTCKDEGMELIITNPCFEVWLVDHLVCCPDTYSEARDAERKASELGIVGGSRNKHVVYANIEGKSGQACKNAAIHNTPERRRKRDQLNDLDFGPWTDMPAVIGLLSGE